MNKKSLGFSLIELSVSIVIIGFIIAAILQGRNILDNARIRAVVSEFSEHQTSANSFKLKYLELPGDFSEANEHWGGANTVSGDGNGEIEFIANGVYEGYRAWQHLSYAKMTKANYRGTTTTAAAVLDTDAPKSSLIGGFFFENNILSFDTNVVALGIPVASTTTILLNSSLTPQQAFAIDNKTDGGNPSTGKIRAQNGQNSTAGTCINANGAGTRDDIYSISTAGKNCILGMSFTELQ